MEPKMAVSRPLTDSVANTSCRKLQALPLKKMDVVELIHAMFGMVTALSFVTWIESGEMVREEQYVVENMTAQVGARAAAPKSARLH